MDSLTQLTLHRRHLHKIPELDRSLPETERYILSVLRPLDCQIYAVADGVCAYFDRGQSKSIAFRADMDALPVTEATHNDFMSEHPGKMHACGHDGHMSMVLALAEYVNTVKVLPYNVLCIFQPAEETTGGAKDICDANILKEHNVTRVFGIHLWPFLESGVIGCRSGAMMAKSSEINVDIYGESTHATTPENGADALYAACRYLCDVYTAKSNDARLKTSIDDATVISFGRMESGTIRNVISNHTSLQGTVRAFSQDRFKDMIGILVNTAKIISASTDCGIEIDHSEGYPPIINDSNLYAELLPAIKKAVNFRELEKPSMASDDYSFYGLHVPSLFFFLGTGTNIALHSDTFDFDEKILLEGLELYKALLHA